MRLGKYNSSEATLRLKMDMYSVNPNMWDQVSGRGPYVLLVAASHMLPDLCGIGRIPH